MPNLTNPASRLLDLARRLQSAGKFEALQALSQCVGVDAKKEPKKALAVLEDFHALLDQVESKLVYFDIQYADMILPHIQQLRGVFRWQGLGATWTKDRVPNEMIFALELAERELNNTPGAHTNNVSQDEVSALAAEVSNLLQDLLNSGMEAHAKELLCAQLERILGALNRYQITGIEGLEAALATGVGEIYLHREKLADLGEEGQKGLRAMRSVLERAHSFVAFANNTYQTALAVFDTLKSLS